MSALAKHQATSDVPLSEALAALTRELRRTAESGEMLEEFMASIAPLLPKGVAQEEMQAVDALVQSIENLARFADAVTRASEGGATSLDMEAAVAVLGLSEMAARLKGIPTAVNNSASSSGDLDLF